MSKMPKMRYKAYVLIALIAGLIIGFVAGQRVSLPAASTNQGATLGLIVHYTDGTSQTYLPTSSGVPLTIIDVNAGKTVSYIQAALYVNAVYSGTLQSYSASTAANAGIYDGSTKALITQFATNMAITASGTNLPSGVSTTISSSTITSATFESLYPSWVAEKTYYYVFAFNSACDGHFDLSRRRNRNKNCINIIRLVVAIPIPTNLHKPINKLVANTDLTNAFCAR